MSKSFKFSILHFDRNKEVYTRGDFDDSDEAYVFYFGRVRALRVGERVVFERDGKKWMEENG